MAWSAPRPRWSRELRDAQRASQTAGLTWARKGHHRRLFPHVGSLSHSTAAPSACKLRGSRPVPWAGSVVLAGGAQEPLVARSPLEHLRWHARLVNLCFRSPKPTCPGREPHDEKKACFYICLIVLTKNPSKALFHSPERLLLCLSSLIRVLLETDLGEGGGREKSGGAGVTDFKAQTSSAFPPTSSPPGGGEAKPRW